MPASHSSSYAGPRRAASALLLGVLLAGSAARSLAQQPDPFGSARTSAGAADSSGRGAQEGDTAPLVSGIDRRLESLDSAVYTIAPDSRFEVQTGRAGLFGFAGHSHVIQARSFHGRVVYYPKAPSRSHLDITVLADSLEVLTPPDTAEIRKVTATMRTDVLHTAEHHEIALASRAVTPTSRGFHMLAALTLVGQTRDVPINVVASLGLDTLRATSSFSVKQTDFGIKPYSGGPGGTVKVADRVTFDIRAVALRAPTDSGGR